MKLLAPNYILGRSVAYDDICLGSLFPSWLIALLESASGEGKNSVTWPVRYAAELVVGGLAGFKNRSCGS